MNEPNAQVLAEVRSLANTVTAMSGKIDRVGDDAERTREMVHEVRENVRLLDSAVRGDGDTIGIRGTVELHQLHIADLQSNRAERRSDVRGAMVGGIGGAITMAIAWVVSHFMGK